jgi:hypothetical protein
VTWDANYVYIGYAGSDVSATTDAANKLLVAYVGDANLPLQGSKTGVTYGNIHYTLPFSAKYVINWQSDWTNFNNASWSNANNAWSWTNPLGMTQASGSSMNQLARNWNTATLELRIPRSALGTNKINLLLHFVNKNPAGQWTYGIAPAASATDGSSSSVTFATFYTFDLSQASAPTAQNPGL